MRQSAALSCLCKVSSAGVAVCDGQVEWESTGGCSRLTDFGAPHAIVNDCFGCAGWWLGLTRRVGALRRCCAALVLLAWASNCVDAAGSGNERQSVQKLDFLR